MAVYFQSDGPLKPWRLAGKCLAKLPVQFRIARLPDLVSSTDTRKIHGALRKAERDLGLEPLHVENAAALFFLLGMAVVEHHAVAGLERRFGAQPNAVALDARHFSEEHAALLAEPGMHQLLVVRAAEPPGGQAAGEGHFHFVLTIGDWRLTSGLARRA